LAQPAAAPPAPDVAPVVCVDAGVAEAGDAVARCDACRLRGEEYTTPQPL
jgi:hypothetical protein